MKPKGLYRLESTDPSKGLWYDSHGNYASEVCRLDCSTQVLPMGYDPRYKKDGKDWFSSCSNKDDLLHWYSVDDVRALKENGFVMRMYRAIDYVEYDLETTFLKETCLEVSTVPLVLMWPEIVGPDTHVGEDVNRVDWYAGTFDELEVVSERLHD